MEDCVSSLVQLSCCVDSLSMFLYQNLVSVGTPVNCLYTKWELREKPPRTGSPEPLAVHDGPLSAYRDDSVERQSLREIPISRFTHNYHQGLMCGAESQTRRLDPCVTCRLTTLESQRFRQCDSCSVIMRQGCGHCPDHQHSVAMLVGSFECLYHAALFIRAPIYKHMACYTLVADEHLFL